MRFDFEHVFGEVAAQVDEIAAVLAGGRVAHHIGGCDSCAAPKYAGFLDALPGVGVGVRRRLRQQHQGCGKACNAGADFA
ncbi:hypothetical protein D3C76_1561970 [compost metagenome]